MQQLPVVDGWFDSGPVPALIGSRCAECRTVFFPPARSRCRNPYCGSVAMREHRLPRRGRVWSYTDARYQPPPPYVPDGDPYRPFALAAVELTEDAERAGDGAGGSIVVLGQVAEGFGVSDLAIGAEVELVVERLYADEDGDRVVWRWRPVEAVPPDASGRPAPGAAE